MMQSSACSRRELLAATAVGWLVRPTQDPVVDPALRSRSVVIVRHAEKASNEARNPELSERGRQRAERLANWFAAAGVVALHATDYRRTQQTLGPLAARIGADIRTYAAGDSASFARSLAAEASDTGAVVVSGHSNTVPQMVAALGGELADLDEKGHLKDDEYDRVVIVTVCGVRGRPMRAVNTLELRMPI